MYFITKIFLLNSFVISRLNCIQIIWDKDASFESNEINFVENGKGDVVRIPNRYFIFPGTKWCGAGNIADNENDLGDFSDTDKCCRSHDFCDDIIEGYQTKYNLTNPLFYTRLNCKCDKEFYKCLKSVKTKPSKQVGHVYFTALGTQCFKKEYPIIKCNEYIYFPRKKCIEYEYDTNKETVYQWFDVPNF